MNIALFTDAFYPQINGVTTALINHIKGLTNKGHRIIIFAPKYKRPKKEIQMNNTKIIRVSSISYPYYKEQKIAFPNLFKIINLLKKFKIDVIHIQSPGLIGISGCLSAKIIKLPLAGTFHALISEFAIYFSLIKPHTKKRKFHNYKFFEQLIKDKYKTRKNLIWNLTTSIYNLCDLVLVPSLSMVKELKKHNIKSQIRYVSNGLNLSNFKIAFTSSTNHTSTPHILPTPTLFDDLLSTNL